MTILGIFLYLKQFKYPSTFSKTTFRMLYGNNSDYNISMII